MNSAIAWQRFLHLCMAGMMLVLMMATVHAAVPHESAVPAYAEEQTILQTEKEMPEPGFGSSASGRQHFDRHYIIPFGFMSEQDVILQRGGNTWRSLRNGPFAMISGVLLLVVPLLLVGFYRMVGPATVGHPDSGRKVQRFTPWERLVHWATAIAFLVLAFTGLIVLFGKNLLLPWMGHDVFAWVAVISKYAHNFVGPLFIVCSLIMFVTFLRKNLFRRWDWQWFRKGGGLLTHEHVPAGFFNAGEKLWFWGGVILLGLVMSVTGLILDFPYLIGLDVGSTRYVQQWANYLHLAGGTLYMVAAMGHIYIGTWGTPGAYDAMRHGAVDEEWAKAHHALWYEEIKSDRQGRPVAGDLPHGSSPRPGT